jgi:hypothetical protein
VCAGDGEAGCDVEVEKAVEADELAVVVGCIGRLGEDREARVPFVFGLEVADGADGLAVEDAAVDDDCAAHR